VRELATRAQSASPLGQYAAPLAAVRMLVSIEPIARALVGLPTFKPNLKAGTGRALQLPGSSWLGPFFSVSCYPDDLIKAEPDVLTVFAGAMSGQRTQVGGGKEVNLCVCSRCIHVYAVCMHITPRVVQANVMMVSWVSHLEQGWSELLGGLPADTGC
jgi:hypothetical protein